MTGRIFDIQHWAVHDGPGIRTQVFLKGCPLRCAWCCNPESQSCAPELRRVHARCLDCGACAAACPHGVDRTPQGRPPAAPCVDCAERPCLAACASGALALCGRDVTADEVVAQVAKDRAFYRNSGGGVTFSGGEPLAQPDFLLACLQGCRDLGIPTALGTCGYAPAQVVDAVEPLADLFLFDLKVADPALHVAVTGVTPDLILDNLRRLANRCPQKVTVRLPLVPGVNDDDACVAALADLAAALGLRTVFVTPYHSLGVSKYVDLGRPAPRDPGPPSDAAVARAVAAFRSRGLDCELP